MNNEISGVLPIIGDTHIVSTEKDLPNIDAKPGDLAITGSGSIYVYSGEEHWVPLSTAANYETNVKLSHNTECPTCGAQSFTSIGDGRYRCDYCDNTYWIGNTQYCSERNRGDIS